MVAILVIGAAASLVWPRKDSVPARGPTDGTENIVDGHATRGSVVVYYFHGTVRCHDCLEIERIARETVVASFSDEMSSGRLRWESVDYDLPANEHFLGDFGLQCPSLALEKRTSGAPAVRTVLTNTWSNVQFPALLEQYVIENVLAFLGEPD